MAISFIGGASANSTTVSLPGTAQAGDLAIVAAGRSNTNGPSAPGGGGWSTFTVTSGGSGGTAHGQLTGWKLLTSTDISNGDVGTWTNASQIIVGVYRGALAVNVQSGTGANGTTLTFPARSGLASTSWQVAVATHRSATDVLSRTVTNYTNRSSGFTSTACGLWDSNGTTTGIAQQTATVNASSGNVGRTLEVTMAPVTTTTTVGASAVLLEQDVTATVGAAGVLQATVTVTATATGLLAATDTRTVSAAGVLQTTGTTTMGAAAVLRATVPISVDATSVLRATVATTAGATAALVQPVTTTATVTSAAVLRATLATSATSDANLSAMHVLTTSTASALQATVTASATAAAVLRTTLVAATTADSVLRRTEELSSVGAAVLRTTMAHTASLDALLSATATKALASSAALLRQDVTADVVGDATLVGDNPRLEVTTSAALQATAATSVFASGVLRTTSSLDVQGDALLAETLDIGVGTDASLVANVAIPIPADALLGATATGTVATNAVLSGTDALDVATGAVLRGTEILSVGGSAEISPIASIACLVGGDAVLIRTAEVAVPASATLAVGTPTGVEGAAFVPHVHMTARVEPKLVVTKTPRN